MSKQFQPNDFDGDVVEPQVDTRVRFDPGWLLVALVTGASCWMILVAVLNW